MESNFKITPEYLEALARAEQRKYKSEWRKNNKDKVRESNKKYWVKKALARLEAESNEEVNADGR